jgi:hypothetical protein
MKHVVVLYSHNFSADFLAEQRLNDKFGMAPNYDSTDIFNEPDGFGKTVKESLQSVDGIQFHQFKHCQPQHDKSRPLNDRNIEVWVEKLRASLPHGETIDAVVIPQGFGIESEANLRWIKEMKQQFPKLKVMVEDPILSYDRPDARRANRFAEPLSEAAQINTMIRKAVITRDNPNYALAEGIDVATRNINDTALANALREMLGMEPLQEVKRGRGVA